jgi:threonine-phosphate decarboxylase
MSSAGCQDGKPPAHGGRVYEFAAARGWPRERVLDLSANLNPLGPPAVVRPVLADAEGWLRHYPDLTQHAVREAAARHLGLSARHVWAAHGATEVIDQVLGLWKPRRVWILTPAFAEYARIARRHGLEAKPVPLARLPDGTLALPLTTLDRVLAASDCLVINNPHNPSGTAWLRQVWEEALRRWLARGVRVLVDEAFMEFRRDHPRYSVVSLIPESPHLVVVRSGTKIFALPGLRFGLGVASPAVVRAVDRRRDPWSVNQLAQEVYRRAYQDAAFLAATWDWMEAAHAWLRETWSQHPSLKVWPTAVNFFLVQCPDPDWADHLAHRLADRGILVRRLAPHPIHGPAAIRVALRSPADNARAYAEVCRIDPLGDVARKTTGGAVDG